MPTTRRPTVPRQLPLQLESGNWNLVQAVVSTNVQNSLGFGKIFNFSLPNFVATSTATFRPRDICVILDFSGSMRFSSLLGQPYYGNRNCNNQDTNVPVFGQYSAGSSTTGMPAGVPPAPYGNANITIASADGRPPEIPISIPMQRIAGGVYGRPVELCHHARWRRSRQEQLGLERLLMPRPWATC